MMVWWSSDLFLNHRDDNPGRVDAIHIAELSVDGAVVSLTETVGGELGSGWDETGRDII